MILELQKNPNEKNARQKGKQIWKKIKKMPKQKQNRLSFSWTIIYLYTQKCWFHRTGLTVACKGNCRTSVQPEIDLSDFRVQLQIGVVVVVPAAREFRQSSFHGTHLSPV